MEEEAKEEGQRGRSKRRREGEGGREGVRDHSDAKMECNSKYIDVATKIYIAIMYSALSTKCHCVAGTWHSLNR